MDDTGSVAFPQPCTDDNRWKCKAFLDTLREHIIPNLGRFYSCQAAPDVLGSDEDDSQPIPGLLRHGARERQPEALAAREAQAAISLVCVDWAAAQRQAEQDVVQVRLWDSDQVQSLASYLRRRPRIAALRLQSPQLDMTDAPGMVAAVSDLLYGSAGDAGIAAGEGSTRSGGTGGGSGESEHHRQAFGAEGGGGRQSTLPRSLRCLEADGATAVPLLLLAAAELPQLEVLSLSQLPAAWTYEEGALPWPPAAEERLGQLLPRQVAEQVADPKLYTIMYGAAVNRRFKSYWSPYDGALAALLLHRGCGLRQLSLEAPSRSVGLQAVDLLASRVPLSLEFLRLKNFGLRREPHQAPRVALERAGLRLADGLRALAGEGTRTGAGGGPAVAAAAEPQPQRNSSSSSNRSNRSSSSWGNGGGPGNIASGGGVGCHGSGTGSDGCGVGGGGGGGSVPSCGPYCGVLGSITNRCCCLTHLELMSCGVEPLEAGVLEGLTGLRSLCLRDSCFTWLDRAPDLRLLLRLRSLDLRRCNWLTTRGAPWDEPLLLPPSLEELDLIGFSSLTSVDLRRLERLTSLAELSDITLLPDPTGGSKRLLQPPYSGLAALTCMDTVWMYVGRARLGCGRAPLTGQRKWASGEGSEDGEGTTTDASSGSGGAGSGGGSDGSSSDGSIRCAAAVRRHRQSSRNWRGNCRARGGGGHNSGSSRCQGVCGAVRGSRNDDGSGGGGPSGGGADGSSGGGSVGYLVPPPLAPSAQQPPLVSLTLYGVLPQYISHLFPALPLLTRLVFSGGKKGNRRSGAGELSDGDGDDENGVGQLVLRAGELQRLRELELRQGILGYGRLALGPATALTRLVVDDVEYVDVRYIELPPSLQHLSLTAWFGLPELYHLAEGPMPLMATAMARAAAGRLQRAAAAAGGGGGGGGGRDSFSGYSSSSSSSSRGGNDEGPGVGDDTKGGQWMGCGGAVGQGEAPQDFTRALEAEVERQFVHRLLPPLRQLRVLQLNWDIVTHGPLVASTARHAPSGGGSGSGGGNSGTAVLRWPFPYLPLLEELNVPWMQELSEAELVRLVVSCPALRGVTHRYGSRRAVRGPGGPAAWFRRCVGLPGDDAGGQAD